MGDLKLNKDNGKNIINIELPVDKKLIKTLNIGDIVSLNGIIATGRDAFHKYVFDNYIKEEKGFVEFNDIKEYLSASFLYHCGPVIKEENGKYEFIAGGPTTSIREEPYESGIISLFELAGVIGKGGMGEKTAKALKKHGAVYLHATGGAASLIGNKVKQIKEVFFLKEFGVPEAVWIIEVENFLCTVTMDSKGKSLHEKIYNESEKTFKSLTNGL